MPVDIEAARKFLKTCIEFNCYSPYIVLTVDTYNDFVRRELIQWFWSNKDAYCVNTHCNWPELVRYVNMVWSYVIEATEGTYNSDVVRQCACNVDTRICKFKNRIKTMNERVTDRTLVNDIWLEKLRTKVWDRLQSGEVDSWTEGLTRLYKEERYGLIK